MSHLQDEPRRHDAEDSWQRRCRIRNTNRGWVLRRWKVTLDREGGKEEGPEDDSGIARTQVDLIP